MKKLLSEIYGAGILFFYYFKWPMILGYPALVYGLDYPRWWVADLLWLYCVILAIKDIVWKFVFKKSYCEEAVNRHTTLEPGSDTAEKAATSDERPSGKRDSAKSD
jgi:hypothetical protein